MDRPAADAYYVARGTAGIRFAAADAGQRAAADVNAVADDIAVGAVAAQQPLGGTVCHGHAVVLCKAGCAHPPVDVVCHAAAIEGDAVVRSLSAAAVHIAAEGIVLYRAAVEGQAVARGAAGAAVAALYICCRYIGEVDAVACGIAAGRFAAVDAAAQCAAADLHTVAARVAAVAVPAQQPVGGTVCHGHAVVLCRAVYAPPAIDIFCHAAAVEDDAVARGSAAAVLHVTADEMFSHCTAAHGHVVVLSLPAVSGGDAAKNSQGHAAVFHDNGVFPGSALFHATAVNDVCLGRSAVQRHAVIQSVPLTALAAVDISYGSAADGNCVPDNMRIYRAAVAAEDVAGYGTRIEDGDVVSVYGSLCSAVAAIDAA